MAKFEIVSPHTTDECLNALDEMAASNPRLLDVFWLGCHHDDHTGYAVVDASSEIEARNMLPSFLRTRAKVVQVERETPERIRSYHQHAA